LERDIGEENDRPEEEIEAIDEGEEIEDLEFVCRLRAKASTHPSGPLLRERRGKRYSFLLPAGEGK
jgi:hypothetical protein